LTKNKIRGKMISRALKSFGHTLVGDPKPLVVHYHVTTACNFRCIFCNIWREGARLYPNQVPADKIKEHLEQFAEIGTVNVDFTGGEPLLRPELGELYAHAKDCGFLTTINTNGWFVERRIEELHNFVDYAQVSLDSPIPEENDYIRGKRGAHKHAVQALKLFKDYSVPVSASVTLTNQTIDRLKGLSEFGQEIGVNMNINVVFPQPLEHAHDRTGVKERMLIDYKRCAQKLDQARYLPNILISSNFVQILKNGGNRKDKPICKAASVMVTIAADGTMILPCFYYPEARFNLSELSVKNAWYSPLAWKVRKNCGRYPYCEGCIARCYLQFSQLGMPRDMSLYSSLVRDYLFSSGKVLSSGKKEG